MDGQVDPHVITFLKGLTREKQMSIDLMLQVAYDADIISAGCCVKSASSSGTLSLTLFPSFIFL